MLGYNATLLRDSVASFFYFAAYEYMKKQLTREGDTSPGVGGTLLAGGVAGTTYDMCRIISYTSSNSRSLRK